MKEGVGDSSPIFARWPPVHLREMRNQCHYPNGFQLGIPIWGRTLSVSDLTVVRIARTSSPFERLESATSLGAGVDMVTRAKAQKRAKTATARRRTEIIVGVELFGQRQRKRRLLGSATVPVAELYSLKPIDIVK